LREHLHKDLSIRKTKRIQWIIVGLVLVLYILFFIPMPYFITSPGAAIELKSIVEVESPYNEAGEFMLTTVSMSSATVASYLVAQFNTFSELIPEEWVLSEDEDSEDYANRQLKVMEQSQENAIIAAHNQLALTIFIDPIGVVVLDLIPGLPGEDLLQVGDIITGVDESPIRKVEGLIDYFQTKKAGDIVSLDFIRNGVLYTGEVELVYLDRQEAEVSEPRRVGIGFYPEQEIDILPSKKIKFFTENIGGPSAGLMFTLEIINQLIPEDLTKGYKIAGTGTISDDGIIGQIGGARLKVKAAFETGAEIFFVPKDIEEDDVNQFDAETANNDLGNPLKIVPVSTLSEAVDFLKKLPPKLEVRG